ncbi:myb domain-containing protein [Heterostelium album PN500]|uniref:Myb domain-containing protein n=1 Tax=Heterostelium pallidum (strain ATCC 26659 / Pp 5 / PN500) TaxID=670386 RepID=D3AZX5_HETP5|nr:myb domain-containing protein [Heterostelium album PN500]EFA84599.1 myb domain-containing protein [Heterostelium album PN500]|eukprot:XP_020436712.1 myb domain-containing protein [Heterostelium album PN500]
MDQVNYAPALSTGNNSGEQFAPQRQSTTQSPTMNSQQQQQQQQSGNSTRYDDDHYSSPPSNYSYSPGRSPTRDLSSSDHDTSSKREKKDSAASSSNNGPSAVSASKGSTTQSLNGSYSSPSFSSTPTPSTMSPMHTSALLNSDVKKEDDYRHRAPDLDTKSPYDEDSKKRDRDSRDSRDNRDRSERSDRDRERDRSDRERDSRDSRDNRDNRDRSERSDRDREREGRERDRDRYDRERDRERERERERDKERDRQRSRDSDRDDRVRRGDSSSTNSPSMTSSPALNRKSSDVKKELLLSPSSTDKKVKAEQVQESGESITKHFSQKITELEAVIAKKNILLQKYRKTLLKLFEDKESGSDSESDSRSYSRSPSRSASSSPARSSSESRYSDTDGSDREHRPKKKEGSNYQQGSHSQQASANQQYIFTHENVNELKRKNEDIKQQPTPDGGLKRRRTGSRKNTLWSAEDDETFAKAYNKYGKSWKTIHSLLPGKTREQVQSHGQYLIRIGKLEDLHKDGRRTRHQKPTPIIQGSNGGGHHHHHHHSSHHSSSNIHHGSSQSGSNGGHYGGTNGSSSMKQESHSNYSNNNYDDKPYDSPYTPESPRDDYDEDNEVNIGQ